MADWFDTIDPSEFQQAAQQSSGGYGGSVSGATGDPRADWQRLVQGLPPTTQTIAQVFPQFAAMYPGSTFEKGDIKGPWGWADVIGNLDSGDGKWQWHTGDNNPLTPPAGSSGMTLSGLSGSLAKGWEAPFSSDASNFSAPTMQQAMDSPGFQFRLNEGLGALQRSAAAKGTLLTGGTLKDLNSWAQDYASSEYDKVYNRALGENQMNYGRDFNEYGMERDSFYRNQDNLFGRNFSLAQLGQNAASNLGAYGSSYMNQGNNLLTGMGNAQAAGTVGSSNAWAPLYGTASDAFNQWWQTRFPSQPQTVMR